MSVQMPLLRERMEDLPALVQHFTTTLASELGVAEPVITKSDLSSLRSYDWPGNIRELRNVLERCLLLEQPPGQCIALQQPKSTTDAQSGNIPGNQLAEVEKRHILMILDREGGNKSAAARILGVSRKTLERKVKLWNETKV